ncbi:MAG: TraB/GumN family protein [Prevotellaceae bacterium]|nr:TraB/GumN family protein [Prevotellaceae bacterium]
MKKLFILIMALLSANYAQSQLLWEISGKGVKKSYIFGTNHLAPATFLDSVPNIYKAFNSTQVVVGEILMSGKNLNDTIMQYATMPQSVSLKSLFSESDYALIDSAVQKMLQINLSDIARLKPAMIMMMYEQAVFDRIFPKNDGFQLDSYFQQIAEMQNKPVFALETAEQQSALLFGNKPLERQAQLLLESIKDSAELEHSINAVVSLYEKGDIEALLVEYKNDKSVSAHEKNELLDDRNLLWAEKIIPIIKQNSAFIAVGALHLAGENGVINLLKKKGLKVKLM